jgi:ATP-binding cassette, subfamily B, bacterial PglK
MIDGNGEETHPNGGSMADRQNSMRETFNKVREILPPTQRRQAVVLFAMMVGMALLESIGVVSILPFVVVASDPTVLHNDGWLGRAYEASGANSENGFLLLLGIAAFVLLLAGNAFKALVTWKIQQFTFLTGHVLGLRLMSAYLAQPYAFFLTRHTAELGKNILAEVQQVVSGTIQPAMMGISRLVIACLLAAILVAADPALAVSVVLVLGGSYALLYGASRSYLTRIGRERFRAGRARFHVAAESFSGIKEIKLRGLERVYCERFSEPSLIHAQRQAASQALAQLPRYGLEVVAFGGVLAIVLYLLATRQGLANALPLISLYAFAGYRMLPNLQEIFVSVAKVRFAEPALSLLYRDLHEKAGVQPERAHVAPLPFRQQIQLDRVSYRYPKNDSHVVRDLTLTIPQGARVGLVGPTGSGKSTLVDLMLGLLEPTAGQIRVDGLALDSEGTIRRWQSQIGYVPQHIFLADDTIAANIAFACPDNDVDVAQVERAARMAQLHDFIVDDLPDGYATSVGERGIRLSGGQRQRLGLARALYGDPAVLVLDEATSALDTATEDEVMAALETVGRDRTVIMIAHRVSTLRNCDLLVRLEKGQIAAVGSYSDVVGLKAAE